VDSKRREEDLNLTRTKRLQEKYETMANEFKTDHAKIHCSVELGYPRDVLIEAADRMKAWMIVCGSGASGTLKGFVVGTVPQYLIQYSKVPVLLISPEMCYSE